MWSSYSAINTHFKMPHDVNINSYATLRVFMLNLTREYMPTKARILIYKQIKKAIAELGDDKDDIIYKVIILLMYFGLLRGTEVLNIRRDELSFMDTGEIQVKYKNSSKTRVKGFSYLIPKIYRKEFQDFLDDWSPD